MKTKPIDYRKHLKTNSRILRGKVCIKGTRVPVYVVLDALAAGETYEGVVEAYGITIEDIRACLAYAALLADEEIIPLDDLVETP